MLGGGNTGSGIANDTSASKDFDQSSPSTEDMDDEIPF